MPSKQSVSVFWFRRDFRFNDNTALFHALDSPHQVLPVFIFDTDILQKLDNKHDARVSFIYDRISELKKELEANGSTLIVLNSSPKDAFGLLISKYNIKAVFANRDYEPEATARDKQIGDLLLDKNIPLYLFKDQVIYEGKEILKQDGDPYKVFTPFKRSWLEKFNQLKNNSGQKNDFAKFLTTDPSPMPSLSSIGFERTKTEFPALVVPSGIIKNYDKTRDFPAINGTSRLGIHFRFGTISIREKAFKAAQLNTTWLNELIWREFYSAVLQHWPRVVDHAFNAKHDLIPWLNNVRQFESWCAGKTGYPLVDAGMRELNHTGYMHNRVRMVVASFLTKHLLIDWRWGERYFADKLLDYELASNNGGWQWAAGTGTDAQPYFRVFNPESQAAKFDPEQNYIKKWIPEFGTSKYPDPMVEHKKARNRAIQTYKKAVSAN